MPFSILPSFRNCLLPFTSPVEEKKYVGEHRTCLCKHECSSSQSFGAAVTLRGLLSPLPSSCAFPGKQHCMTQCFNSWVNGLTGWCAHNLHQGSHSFILTHKPSFLSHIIWAVTHRGACPGYIGQIMPKYPHTHWPEVTCERWNSTSALSKLLIHAVSRPREALLFTCS